MRRTVILFRFGVNISYYGLTLDVSGLGLNVYQTQLLLGATELPSKITVYFLVRQVGRRFTEAGMLLGAALTFGISMLVSLGELRSGSLALPSAKTLPHTQGAPGIVSSLQESLSLQRPSSGSLLWWYWAKGFLKQPSLPPTCLPLSCTLLCSGELGSQTTDLP